MLKNAIVIYFTTMFRQIQKLYIQCKKLNKK